MASLASHWFVIPTSCLWLAGASQGCGVWSHASVSPDRHQRPSLLLVTLILCIIPDSRCDIWEIIALMSHQASLRPRVKSKESANLSVFFPGVQAGAGVRFVTASFSRGLGPDLINLSHEPLLTEYFSVLAHNILNWRKNNGTSVIARKKIQTTY